MGAAPGAPQVQGLCRSRQGCAYGAHVLWGSGWGTGPPAALSVSRPPSLPRSEPPPSPLPQAAWSCSRAPPAVPHPFPVLAHPTSHLPTAPPGLSFPQLPSGAGVHPTFPKWGLGSGVWVRALHCSPWPAGRRPPSPTAGGTLCLRWSPSRLLPSRAPRPHGLALLAARLNGSSVCLPLAGPRPTLGGGSGSWLARTPRGLKSWKRREFPTFFSRFSPAQMQSCLPPAGWPPPTPPLPPAPSAPARSCAPMPLTSPPSTPDPNSLPPHSLLPGATAPHRAGQPQPQGPASLGRRVDKDKQDSRPGPAQPRLAAERPAQRARGGARCSPGS